MNQAGRDYAQRMAEHQCSAIEYRNRLVRTHNMSCICHCSAEIDLSTLLYFSVNDMHVGQGAYVLVLFSEISERTPEQAAGRDVYSRMYTYSIIEEIATEVFTGRHAFYSSELDGRLVFLIHFPFGILPDPSLVSFLGDSCLEISNLCRERYDLEVVSYISDPIDNINFTSGIYSKLLESATLHRYLEFRSDTVVFYPPLGAPSLLSDFSSTIRDRAMRLVSAIVNDGDYHALADQILKDIVDSHPLNIDILKQLFVLLLECLYSAAKDLGIKLKSKEQRRDDFRCIFDSLHLRTVSEKFHRILDELKKDHGQLSRRTVQRQLDTALQFIDENLSNADLTLERCAEAVQCSTSALNKVFRRQLNTSVARYIRELRLEKAYKMLQAGVALSETGRQCGFGSTETFHRLFKERYGVTPGQLRTQRDTGKTE